VKRFALALGFCCSVPAHAAAFSDYELFPLDPLLGGGGGRFFTGSPVDGLGCSVCHRGAPEPQVLFRGLPAGEYVPGAAYDVEVSWTNAHLPHALALEFVNALGQAAGQLAPLDASARCSGELSGEPAVHLTQAAGRTILMLDDCGAANLRFRFTAPADPQLVFAASVVRSDASETPEGDGVVELRQLLVRQGTTGGTSTSTCSAGRPPDKPRALASLPWLAALALGTRRGKRRRFSGNPG
jgi:hypothetical protein